MHCLHCFVLVESAVMTDERSYKMNFQMLLDMPKIVGVLCGTGVVCGLAVLGDELFVVRSGATQLEVYNTNTFTLLHIIETVGSAGLCSASSSLRYKCLYISDIGVNMVHRHSLADNVTSRWSVGGGCLGLSLTRDNPRWRLQARRRSGHRRRR